MKKISLFTILLYLGMCQSNLLGWKGRVVPMSFDKQTNQWNILLAKDTQTNFWSDFFQEAQGGERSNDVAMQALTAQTNGVYNNTNVSFANQPWERTTTGDVIHFVMVPFISGNKLFTSAKNSIKNDFVWIPVNYITQSSSDITPPSKSNNISRGVLAMLRIYLPQVLSKLALPTVTNPAHAAAQAQGGIYSSWLGIPDAIYFYDKGKPYYEFTNFWGKNDDPNFELSIDGKEWPTTEHYFQAQKFVDPSKQEQIRLLNSPSEVFRAMRGVPTPQNWHAEAKFDAMLKALRAKFQQNKNLKQMLLNTGNAIIVEASPRDAEWGYGNNDPSTISQSSPRVELGLGKNHLGQMLLHVREELTTGQQKPYAGLQSAQDFFSAHATQQQAPPTTKPTPASQPARSTDQLKNALTALEQALINMSRALV